MFPAQISGHISEWHIQGVPERIQGMAEHLHHIAGHLQGAARNRHPTAKHRHPATKHRHPATKHRHPAAKHRHLYSGAPAWRCGGPSARFVKSPTVCGGPTGFCAAGHPSGGAERTPGFLVFIKNAAESIRGNSLHPCTDASPVQKRGPVCNYITC